MTHSLIPDEFVFDVFGIPLMSSGVHVLSLKSSLTLRLTSYQWVLIIRVLGCDSRGVLFPFVVSSCLWNSNHDSFTLLLMLLLLLLSLESGVMKRNQYKDFFFWHVNRQIYFGFSLRPFKVTAVSLIPSAFILCVHLLTPLLVSCLIVLEGNQKLSLKRPLWSKKLPLMQKGKSLHLQGLCLFIEDEMTREKKMGGKKAKNTVRQYFSSWQYQHHEHNDIKKSKD